jgi:SAM-dependent methyltransferase
MTVDYAAITERSGSHLNAEQMARFVHRYAVCAAHARGRILEVACGAAIGLGALQARGLDVTGLCYTRVVLQEAQAYYRGRLPLLSGDAQDLPLAARSYDTLLCLEAIYYFPDRRAFLAEARRVLTPGGLLLIGWSNPDWQHFVPGPYAAQYPRAPELVAELQAAGFEGIQLLGAFPLHAADSRHAAAMRLRRLLLRPQVARLIRPAAAPLKRIAYGRLHALPAELPVQALEDAVAALHLQPLRPHAPDTTHRVLYTLARV